jgi:spore protease
MSKIDLAKFNIRTDLIIEDNKISHNEKNIDGLTITTSMKNGNYVTLSFDDVTDKENYNKVKKYFTEIIKDILKLNNISDEASCLIIGLGNILSTPDSLGVKSLDNIIVTSHLFELGNVSAGMRRVSCFIPGVMANTGIESSKIIKAIINEIKPDFVIAIDALASRSIDRINKTIQITDTGIHPGSGIGNNRLEISKDTMGIPVIAIGVPTVVMSSTIVYDTIDYLIKHISFIKENESINKLSFRKTNYVKKLKDKELSNQDKENLLGLFGSLSEKDKRSLIDEVLNNTELNMIVTPTEIDFLIDKLSNIIAESINSALHRQIT